MKRGVTQDQVEGDLASVSRRMRTAYPDAHRSDTACW
jgi:hypothetical protein